MGTDRVRVHLNLDRYFLELLTDQALQTGNTKAGMLRIWIQNIDINKLSDYPLSSSSKQFSFNLRMTKQCASILDTYAQQLELCRNDMVRLIIFNAIFNPHCLSKAKGIITDDPDYDKMKFVKDSINSANYNSAVEMMDMIEGELVTKPRSEAMLVEVNILRAKLFRHQRRLDAARKSLDTSLELAQMVTRKFQVRECLSQLAVLDEIQDRMEDAIEKAKKAVGLDEEQRAQARLLNLHALQLNHAEVDKIIKESQHYTYDWWNQRLIHEQRVGMAELRLGRVDAACRRFESLDSKIDPQMKTELRYNLENRAVIDIVNGNDDAALLKLFEAEEIELKTKSREDFSKSRLFRLFIESKSDFEYCFHQMLSMVELQSQPVYVGLGRYVTNAAAYLHSPKGYHQRRSKQNLIEMSKAAPNNMLKGAALQTLKSNTLVAVI